MISVDEFREKFKPISVVPYSPETPMVDIVFVPEFVTPSCPICGRKLRKYRHWATKEILYSCPQNATPNSTHTIVGVKPEYVKSVTVLLRKQEGEKMRVIRKAKVGVMNQDKLRRIISTFQKIGRR